MSTSIFTIEDKRKHLEFIQNVVNRMGADSFFAKGWSVTLVAALFVLSSKDANTKYIVVALIPTVAFWILDGYFLWQERLFRALYDHVRAQSDTAIDYSMSTEGFVGARNTWFRSIFSTSLILFYLPLLLIMIIVFWILG